MIKTCIKCGKEFNGRTKNKFCFKSCYHSYLIGKPSWNKGKKLSKKHIDNLIKSHKGKYTSKESFHWKGDNVGYCALHEWVSRYKGKPTKCEHCGKIFLRNSQIHWANIDHKYRRRLNDFIRLCSSCHKIYDYKNHLKRND